MDDMCFSNDNLSSNTNPRFFEEWEGEIIMLFRVKFRSLGSRHVKYSSRR